MVITHPVNGFLVSMTDMDLLKTSTNIDIFRDTYEI